MVLPGRTLLALTVCVAAAAWFAFGYGYIEDDAFIHLEFARSLTAGNGFSFNGHVVNGDTAPAWVLILAAIHASGLSWIASAKVACALGVAAAISGAWAVGSELAAGRPQQRFLPLTAVLVTVCNPFFAHWVFAGMESVAALGLSFWVMALGLSSPPTLRRCAVAAVLLAVAPLLRPEFLLFDAIVAPLMLWRLWNSRAGSRTTILALGILMCIPLAAWSVYALRAFGGIVPTTNLAKQAVGSSRELAPRLLSVYALGFPVTLGLLPAAALVWFRRGSSSPGAGLPMLWVLLVWPLACMAFYLANHTLVQTRYVLVSMPNMSIAVLWLIAEARRSRLLIAAAATMVLTGFIVTWAIVVPHITNKQRYIRVLSAVSDVLRDRIPERAPVAVFAIGQIAFESQHPLVDIGGITDKSVIPYMGNPAATLRWAKARGARYYITSEAPEPGAVRIFTMNAPFLGWTFRRSDYLTEQPVSVYALP